MSALTLLVANVGPFRKMAAEMDVDGIRAAANDGFKRAHAVSFDRRTTPCPDLTGAECVSLNATGCTFRDSDGNEYGIRF